MHKPRLPLFHQHSLISFIKTSMRNVLYSILCWFCSNKIWIHFQIGKKNTFFLGLFTVHYSRINSITVLHYYLMWRTFNPLVMGYMLHFHHENNEKAGQHCVRHWLHPVCTAIRKGIYLLSISVICLTTTECRVVSTMRYVCSNSLICLQS